MIFSNYFKIFRQGHEPNSQCSHQVGTSLTWKYQTRQKNFYRANTVKLIFPNRQQRRMEVLLGLRRSHRNSHWINKSSSSCGHQNQPLKFEG